MQLKSIALALPVCTMACFKLSEAVCKEITKTITNFWWGEEVEKRKIHWRSWKKMTLTKENGGLNFKDLEAFNDALLEKKL